MLIALSKASISIAKDQRGAATGRRQSPEQPKEKTRKSAQGRIGSTRNDIVRRARRRPLESRREGHQWREETRAPTVLTSSNRHTR
jgi:hypothetical protein